MCTTQVLIAQDGQQRALNPLEVESQMIVSGDCEWSCGFCESNPGHLSARELLFLTSHLSSTRVWFAKYASLLVWFM